MGRASEILIPSRFLLTVGHAVTILLAYHHQDANVSAALSSSASSSSRSSASSSLLAALVLSTICVVFELASLLGGFTLFFDRLNTFHSVTHFFGGVLTAWYITDVWGYNSYWWIFVLFGLIPTIFELSTLLLVYSFKIIRF